MLTVFTIPKSFKDPKIKLIQENAILSWKKIHPEIEIFLIGPDKDLPHIAKKLGVKAIASVKTNKFGTPFLDSVFSTARKKASYPLLLYTNTDIIFIPKDLRYLVKQFKTSTNFLLVGGRWDLNHNHPLDLIDPFWAKKLKRLAKENGHEHPKLGSDYFLFPKQIFEQLPPFLVGRVGWDNWLLHHAKEIGLKTIDVTGVNFVVHQNHDYKHQINKGRNIETNPEALHNLSLISQEAKRFTLKNLSYRLTRDGLTKQRALPPWANRAIKPFLCLLTILFLVLRFSTAANGLIQICKDMFNMLIIERNLSYDEKMLRMRDSSYVYIKHLRDVTPSNADICFSDQVGNEVTPFIAASHLYPRSISVIPVKADGPQNCQGILLPIRKNKPRFIMLYHDFPPFIVPAKKVYLFGHNLDSPVTTYENINYSPGSILFQGTVGVIEL